MRPGAVIPLFLSAVASPGALMPLPSKMTPGSGSLPIDAGFHLSSDGCPAASELLPLSANLKTVGEIGLQALVYLETGEAAPAQWLAQANHALDEMEQPVAEVVLAAVRPVRLLLGALGPGSR